MAWEAEISDDLIHGEWGNCADYVGGITTPGE